MWVLPAEYGVVTKVTNNEEEYSAEDMVGHRTICYYVMNDGCVQEQYAIFERLDMGMTSHLKPLFTKEKIWLFFHILYHAIMSSRSRFDQFKIYQDILIFYLVLRN